MTALDLNAVKGAPGWYYGLRLRHDDGTVSVTVFPHPVPPGRQAFRITRCHAEQLHHVAVVMARGRDDLDDDGWEYPPAPPTQLFATYAEPARCVRCRNRRYCARTEHWTSTGVRRARLCWSCTLQDGLSINDDEGRENREELAQYCAGSPAFGCGMADNPDGLGMRTVPTIGGGGCGVCGGLDPWDEEELPPAVRCPACKNARPVRPDGTLAAPVCPSCLFVDADPVPPASCPNDTLDGFHSAFCGCWTPGDPNLSEPARTEETP